MVIPYPFDTIRRRLLMQSGRSEIVYSGLWNSFFKSVRNEGILSLYRGFTANIFRGTGGALVLAIYDEIQKYL